MKTSFVSSLALQNSLRLQVETGQLALTKAQKEASTGQYADFGLSLGGHASDAVSLSNSVGQLQTLVDSNSMVNTRLSSAQDALGQISDSAQTALDALLGITGSSGGSQIASVQNTVKNAFETATGAANLSASGEYLFGGTNSGTPPLNDYFASGGSSAKTAFETSFQTFFGFSIDDPAVAGISGSQMNAFLDQAAADFDGPAWQADWSNATDTPLTSRINTNEVIATSTTANSEGFRKLALGSVLTTELLGKALSPDAKSAVAQRATTAIGDAISAIDADRATLGVAQSRVKQANDSISNQIDLVKTQMNDLESVDPYEAATRVNTLTTQLETSYALTSRISQLSLLNYL